MEVRISASLRRMMTEGAIIVFSILLAFWIDAWWDQEQRKAEEHLVLQALYADLLEKRALLARNQKLTDAVIESATTLLRAPALPALELTNAEVDRFLGNLLWYLTPSTWESAPLNSLSMGGENRLISNIVLRHKLADLQVKIDRMKSSFRDDTQFHYATLTPFLMNNANLVQITQTYPQGLGNVSQGLRFPDIEISTPFDHHELLSNAKFRGLLVLKLDIYINMKVFDYPVVEPRLDEVISILERELAH